MSSDDTPDSPPDPTSPRDRTWWSAFGEALMTGDLDAEVDPEAREMVRRIRSGLADAASLAAASVTGPGTERILARLDSIETRLVAIERLLADDQRTTPTA